MPSGSLFLIVGEYVLGNLILFWVCERRWKGDYCKVSERGKGGETILTLLQFDFIKSKWMKNGFQPRKELGHTSTQRTSQFLVDNVGSIIQWKSSVFGIPILDTLLRGATLWSTYLNSQWFHFLIYQNIKIMPALSTLKGRILYQYFYLAHWRIQNSLCL